METYFEAHPNILAICYILSCCLVLAITVAIAWAVRQKKTAYPDPEHDAYDENDTP